MTKTDKSKHMISIASIKRSISKPDLYKWTKFYESNLDFSNSEIKIELNENELIICSTIVNLNNYSILTTQKLITKENGTEHVGKIIGATDKGYGNFKGYKENSITFGLLKLENGTELKYFIETGNASMVMIYGIRTIIRIVKPE